MDFRAFLVTTAAAACLAFGFANAADAQNLPPLAGPVIDQITGQPVIGTYTTRTVDFTATNPITNLSFAFREDPSDIGLDNVSLVDLTHPSGNLVVNGDFEAGPPGEAAPPGWTYLRPFDVGQFGGSVFAGCGTGGSNCYADGAVQAYDAITQAIATTPGDLYHLSYDYANSCLGGDCGIPNTYQPLSTNGQPAKPATGATCSSMLAPFRRPSSPNPPAPRCLGRRSPGCCWRASGAATSPTRRRFAEAGPQAPCRAAVKGSGDATAPDPTTRRWPRSRSGTRVRERRDRHQRVRRHLLSEEFLADRAVIGAMPDVGQVGIDLDDIGHRAAAGLDLRFQALQCGARLRLEIACMRRRRLPAVGDLARR